MKIRFDVSNDGINKCFGVSDDRFLEILLLVTNEAQTLSNEVSQKDLINFLLEKIECRDQQEAAFVGFLMGGIIGIDIIKSSADRLFEANFMA